MQKVHKKLPTFRVGPPSIAIISKKKRKKSRRRVTATLSRASRLVFPIFFADDEEGTWHLARSMMMIFFFLSLTLTLPFGGPYLNFFFW